MFYVVIVIALWLTVISYIDNYNKQECNKAVIEHSLNFELKEGKVEAKFIDKSYGSRGGLKIKIDNKFHIIYNNEMYEKIKVGDIVKKEKGSLFYYINDVKYEY